MAKPSDRSPERKLQVVLSVLRGELSATEAARRAGVAEQTVHNWKRAFLEAGRDRGDYLVLDQVDGLPSVVPAGRSAHVETTEATASGTAAQLTLRAVSRCATRGGLPARRSGARCIQSSPRTAAEPSSAHLRSMSNPRLCPVEDSARPCANDEIRRRPARQPKAPATSATSPGCCTRRSGRPPC